MKEYIYTNEDLHELQTAFCDYVNSPENTEPNKFFRGQGILRFLENALDFNDENLLGVIVSERYHDYILCYVESLCIELRALKRLYKEDTVWRQRLQVSYDHMAKVKKTLYSKRPLT